MVLKVRQSNPDIVRIIITIIIMMLRCCVRCLTVLILVADDLKTFITRLYRVKHLAYVTLRPQAVWRFNVY